jgi:hypothetical protein
LLSVNCLLSSLENDSYPDAINKLDMNLTANHFFRQSLVNEYYFRLKLLIEKVDKSVLVHVHIPKASGTALARALASNCVCDYKNIATNPIACENCLQVEGVDGYMFNYSVSRLTGWQCKGHAPLAVMRNMPCNGKFTLLDKKLYPVYVTMFREPFDRFISEALHWCKYGTCSDWSIDWTVTKYDTKMVKNCDGNMNNASDDCRVIRHIRLPDKYMIHNRQVKFIGGKYDQFDMNFDGDKDIGTRWKGSDVSFSHTYDRAVDIITRDEHMLILLAEEFKKSLCILSIIYGQKYQFNWHQSKHSHTSGKKYDSKTEISSYRKYLHTGIYEEWYRKNKADVKFYTFIKSRFYAQFEAAIRLYKENKRKNLRCKDFL